MKKAANAKKKLAEKQDKVREKAHTKGQISLDIRQITMSNRQVVEVGIFKDILSNSIMAPNEPDGSVRDNVEKSRLKEVPMAIRRTFSDKKKNKA